MGYARLELVVKKITENQYIHSDKVKQENEDILDKLDYELDHC